MRKWAASSNSIRHSAAFRSFQVLSGPFRFFQVLSGPFRSFQVLSGPFRSFQVLSGPFRSFQVLSGPFRSFQVLSTPELGRRSRRGISSVHQVFSPEATYKIITFNMLFRIWIEFGSSFKLFFKEENVLQPDPDAAVGMVITKTN
jgi:hypothetical protein